MNVDSATRNLTIVFVRFPMPDRLIGMLPQTARHVLLIATTATVRGRTGLDDRYPEMTIVLPPHDASVTSTSLLALRASPERLPLRTGAFDLVVADLGVSENHDLARVLCEVGRVLRPRGALGMAVDSRARTLSALIHLLLPNGFSVPVIAQEMAITNAVARRTA